MCKVGTGYTMQELHDLNLHLTQSNCLIPSKRGAEDAKEWLDYGNEMPDVFVKPSNSKILEVRIDTTF
jgi:hypothetical protein